MSFTRDLVSYYGAPADGQHALVSITTLVAGDPTLVVATPIFAPGDVGKIIQIRNAGGGGANDYVTLIRSYTSATEIELFSFNVGSSWTVSGTTKDIWWGTNCNDFFIDFRTEARAEAEGAGGLCTLTIPSGFYAWGCNDGGSGGFPYDNFDEIFWTNAPLVRILGVSNPTVFGAVAFGCYHAIPGEPGYVDIDAPIADAQIGDTTITLLDPADSAKFVVGRTQTYHTSDPYVFGGMLLITGFEMQGYGSPPNPRFFDFIRMSSINPGTGVITLASPLTDGPYLSTYPDWNGTEPLPSGVARVAAMDKYWDSDITIEGITVQVPSTGVGNGARSITYKDITVGGDNFPNASVAGTVTIDNVHFTFTEADKIVETFNIQNGCTGETSFQSASIKQVNITDCGSGMTAVNGTPRHLTITNSDIPTLVIGAAYGQTETLTATNCALGTTHLGLVGSISHTHDGWTMPSPGAISYPGTLGGLSWGFPGAIMIWQWTYNYQGTFKVLGVTQPFVDGVNDDQLIQTDIAFTSINPPPIDDPGSDTFIMMGHPCQRAFLTDCTGPQAVLDASKAGGYGKPFYSYAYYDYDQDHSSSIPFEVWGKLVSIKVHVMVPYTGSTPVAKVHFANAGGNYPVYAEDGTKYFYDPAIDIRAAGLRTITPSGVVGEVGLDSGLAWPDLTAMFSGMLNPGPTVPITPDSDFHFTLEIETDQQVEVDEVEVSSVLMSAGCM